MDRLADIETRRLLLRLLSKEAIHAGLAGDSDTIARSLGVTVPPDLLARPTGFMFAQAQLTADPAYLPWSLRAIVLKSTREMVGHIRFHSLPDPEYLHPFARNAIEFGYEVFAPHRRLGYAAEAVETAMRWAADAPGVSRFVVTVAPDNLPSLGLAAKFGFRRIGEHIDEVDGLEYVLLREAL